MSSLESVRTLLREALERSRVVKFLREAKASNADAISRARALTPDEISGLESRGNYCGDWSMVRLSGNGTLGNIRNCRFEGSVILRFDSALADSAGATLWNSSFRDVILGTVTIENVSWVRHVRIEDGAFLSNAGTVSGFKNSLFNLGTYLQPGNETGARKVFLVDGLTVADCAAMSASTPAEQEILEADLKALLAGLETDYAYVGSKAVLKHAVVVENCFIGPGATVRGAATLRNSILASTLEYPVHIQDASIVCDSILDEGAGVHEAAQVHRSLLLEQSGAHQAGHVSNSVLGPNTLIAKGEITASLVGPFTGFHHQSLLIGTLWPEGRGNVGYGANVGSNHTGRKPDQELRAGEGTFFGLGCSIKFPANFEAAPYSLFATGVITPPQKIEFPFSLVTASQEGRDHGSKTSGLNEIAPGWMWGENAYALIRNAYKYADRNVARRHSVPDLAPAEGNALGGTFLSADLFAPRIAGWVLDALGRFPKVAPLKKSGVYLEDEIAGLGKNFVKGPGVKKARNAYRNYLAFVLVREALWTPGASPTHSDAGRRLLKALELDSERAMDIEALFEGLALAVEASLAKDEERGTRVFADYADFHTSPATDPVCLRLRADLAKLLAAWRLAAGAG